jgi:hypothetical protein
MIVRRFAVFAFSAAIGFGIALHELPNHHPALAATTVSTHLAR